MHVYKPANNQVGTDCFINAAETCVLGWRQGRAKGVTNFPDPNPTLRHNLFLAPNVGTKHVDAEGMAVNTTQKPTLTTYQLGRRFVEPGGNVLVIGSGSGSDVIGFVYAGCNVTAVEKDPKQFDLQQARVSMCMDPQGTDRPRFLTDLARAERMQQFINCNEKLSMQQAIGAVESKLVCGKYKQILERLVKRDRASQLNNGDPCIVCGDDIKAGALWRCSWDGSDMHLACCIKCSKCSELYCSDACKDNHICSAVAPEVAEKDEEAVSGGEGGGGGEPVVVTPAVRNSEL